VSEKILYLTNGYLMVLEPHHAQQLVNPKVLAKKRILILDTLEHVDSEKLNRQIDLGPPLFFPNVIKIHNMWLKLAKID
jgi:hypothetical protein